MAWEDNRNKGMRDVAKEEHLAWLQKQIAEMEMARGYVPPTAKERAQPRIRRNGVYVDGKGG